MADNKNSREDQARAEKRRQQEREIKMAVERGDEPRPPVEPETLAEVEAELEDLSFPATGAEVVAAIGDGEIEATDGHYRIADLVPETDTETFDSPAAVSAQIQQPTVAAAMKRVVEASSDLREPDFGWTRRKAYERTFAELAAIDIRDEDPGIRAITDWIVERIEETESLPSSRAVRRQAAKYCRANGYEIRNDQWLGV